MLKPITWKPYGHFTLCMSFFLSIDCEPWGWYKYCLHEYIILIEKAAFNSKVRKNFCFCRAKSLQMDLNIFGYNVSVDLFVFLPAGPQALSEICSHIGTAITHHYEL